MKKHLNYLTITLVLGLGASARAAVTGQWDFNSGDLSATVGTGLAYRGDTAATTTFSTATIGGSTANVMSFPATTQTQGYIMTHGIAPNGGGLYVNQYSLIMDIMFPTASSGVYRSLFQTAPLNDNDGDLFVNPDNGIGISSSYQGSVLPDTWHRVAFVFDLTLAANRLNKYVDGTLVGSQNLSAGADGRWALDTTALLFADEDGETAAGFVNSIQIHDVALSGNEIGLLGGATAAGIPNVVPEPTSGLLLGLGLLLAAGRGYRRSR
ncbi:MAG: PEP-CTERM sorting domain-containing protein [Verrucomicrobia bacterium]|nr:PEP-CTERM sorting domain-containing protein [Verrucomicrobiota bacterium]